MTSVIASVPAPIHQDPAYVAASVCFVPNLTVSTSSGSLPSPPAPTHDSGSYSLTTTSRKRAHEEPPVVAVQDPPKRMCLSPDSFACGLDALLAAIDQCPSPAAAQSLTSSPSSLPTPNHDAAAQQPLLNTLCLPPPAVEPRLLRIGCYHAKVAQKSYGSEKRFLAPPPVLCVTGLQGLGETQLVAGIGGQGVQMVKVPESECAGIVLRSLYVPSCMRSKQFVLDFDSQVRMQSLPIAIISKPSKKTVKTIAPGALSIPSGSHIALFNRINSQTVRTKFLSYTADQFTADAVWSPVVIRSLHNQPCIQFGSVIVLESMDANVKSKPLRILRVEKNQIHRDAQCFVGQMHKIVLEEVTCHDQSPSNDEEPSRSFWGTDDTPLRSASSSPKPAHVTLRQQKETVRDEEPTSMPLRFAPSELSVGEVVPDTHCWTIVGVDHFEHELRLW